MLARNINLEDSEQWEWRQKGEGYLKCKKLSQMLYREKPAHVSHYFSRLLDITCCKYFTSFTRVRETDE